MSEEMGGEVSSPVSESASSAPTTENQSTSSTETSAPSISAPEKSGLSGLEKLKQIAQKAQNPKNSTQKSPITKAVENAAAAANGQVSQPYNPNFKVKFFDAESQKHLEKEIDEWARGFIKDPETEKKFRDLYEKAYGLETTKASREKYKGEANSLRTEVRETKQALNTLSTFVQSGDMQSFFEALKIPEDKVLKYALDRLQYRDMPPEQRQQYDSLRDQQARARYLEEQNHVLAQTMQEQTVQSRGRDLDTKLSDPQVTQLAQAFDSRVGTPGAFRDEVIRRGQYHWHQFQRDIPVEQAVSEVMQLIGGYPQQPPAITPQAPASTPQAEVSTPAITVGKTVDRIPVLPNIQGSGASPVKRIPRSINDLKKLREGMTA